MNVRCYRMISLLDVGSISVGLAAALTLSAAAFPSSGRAVPMGREPRLSVTGVPSVRPAEDKASIAGPSKPTLPQKQVSAAQTLAAGCSIAVDPIVGALRFVPASATEGVLQGSPPDESCRGKDELPFRHVLTRSLAVMETEVTRGMWRRLKEVVPALPNDPTLQEFGDSNTHPVQNVAWPEALLFANLLSAHRNLQECYYVDAKRTRLLDAANYLGGSYYCDFSASGYRLPAEGEWEYFARAGLRTAFPVPEPSLAGSECFRCPKSGFEMLALSAWLCFNSEGHAWPAALKDPNPWGLYDLSGNVREWCWDWQEAYPVGTVQDYAGPESGVFRVVRGSAFNAYPRAARSANRFGGTPKARTHTVGFRLVRSLPPSSPEVAAP